MALEPTDESARDDDATAAAGATDSAALAPPPAAQPIETEPVSGWVLAAPTPGPSGWVAASQAQPATKPLRERHPIVQVVVWVVGMLGLGVVAIGATNLEGRTGTAAYQMGRISGTFIFGFGVALVVVFFVARARRNAGHASIDWAWTLPIAAVLILVAAGGAQRTTSPAPAPAASATPPATTSPAKSYDRISSPFSLGPTTSADADLVANLTSSIGTSGISDVSVVRVLDASSTRVGYLIVIAAPGASSDANQAFQGMLDGLRESSISPTSSTIDGRSVSEFAEGQASGAIWLDGDFFVEVVATDPSGAGTLAKAVLDAR